MSSIDRAQRPKPGPIPAGYFLVTDVSIEVNDLIWNDSDCLWEDPESSDIGDDSNAYFGVVRKT